MGKKGLIIYDTIYSSTIEVSFWIKALIGEDQHVDVKHQDQVLTITPYDYIIIGSFTRMEKPSKRTLAFIEKNKEALAQKQVAYFLTCGDTDETMVLKVPGQKAHLIGGRNYLIDTIEKYPQIKPVAIAGFGGRQVMHSLGRFDSFTIFVVGKLAKEGQPWEGLDIWESLVPERVEVFANEIRERILDLPSMEDPEKLRGYWTSLQPGNANDANRVKYTPKKVSEQSSTAKIFFHRSRIKSDLEGAKALVNEWASSCDMDLREITVSAFNTYYHAVKKYDEKELTIHVVASNMSDDPGNIHIAFRCWDKPAVRNGAEEDIKKAEELLWAEGRRVE